MKIKKIELKDYEGDVYNLRIEDNHNYFVDGLCVSNCHQAKAKSYLKILENTFTHAYSRFGVSGTTPPEDSCEILTIQSVLGPKITEVSASELKDKGIITPMEVKVVVMNHNNAEFEERVKIIKKGGGGKDAFDLEKGFIHISEKRLEFIKKIVQKCQSNTLLLFHTIEYGQQIFNKLKAEIGDKDFYYIDGDISGKKREEIKKEMEKTKEKIEWTILNFGEFEVEVMSDFQILLTDGSFKNAGDLTPDDDIDDNFLKSLKKNKK